MRQHLIALALVPAIAMADKPDKHAQLDVKDAAGKINAFKDATGKIYIIPKPTVDKQADLVSQWTFYGDGKTMYQQRIIGSSLAEQVQSLQIWSPRVRGLPAALLYVRPDGADISCKMKGAKYEHRPLTQLSEDQANKLLETAKFFPPFFEHQSYFFGRGESTTYYLVDQLRPEFGGAGYRLWIGRKGQMKSMTITDFADDTAGSLIVTKTGELKIERKGGPATWKQGAKAITITRLNPSVNGYLIFRELGVYAQLGTVCEDQ